VVPTGRNALRVSSNAASIVGVLIALAAVLGTVAVTVGRAAPAGAAVPDRLVLIGDSVTAGARRDLEAALGASFPGLVIDAEVCRGTLWSCRTPSQTQPPSTGRDVVQANAGRLGTRLVVALGYNDAPSAGQIDTFLTAARAAGATRVSWVAVSTRRGGATGTYARFNRDLVAAQARWPGLGVLDWDEASSDPDADAWFSDDVHLTAAGNAAFARFLRGALVGAPAPSATRCRGDAVTGVAADPPVPVTASPLTPGDGLRTVTPARRLDTRELAPLGAGRTVPVVLGGWGSVPAGAGGVVLNVTVVDACAPGYLSVHPCRDGAPPLASNLNYRAGQTVANLVTVALGYPTDPAADWQPAPPRALSGSVCLTTQSRLDVVVDVVGWWGGGGSGVVAQRPSRLLDTRSGAPVAAGGVVGVAVGGAAGALVTVTAVDAAGPGHVTVWPASSAGVCRADARPTASSLNPEGPAAVANLAVVATGGGRVCLYSSVRAHLVVDLAGRVADGGSRWAGTMPWRLLDTRATGGRFEAGEARPVAVRIDGGPLPAGTTAVGVNLTVVDPDAAGHLTAWPAAADGSCRASDRPTASVLNHPAAGVVPGFALVGLGGQGRICLFSWAAADVVVDLTAATA
jgi:hypothetical protein